jgi:large exoprotein involved in heme utilization and adhesion
VGSVAISTPALTIDDSFVSTSTLGAGPAGRILLDVGTLTMMQGAHVESSSEVVATGAGGEIVVTATGSVTLAGRSPFELPSSLLSTDPSTGIFSTARGSGDAGQITVSTPTLTMADGGTISVATSGAGDAGNIGLNVGSFDLASGARVDSGTTGSGKGGTVTVNATGSGIISSGGGLFSNAEGSGAGGDLNIQAAQLQLLDGAIVSAESTGSVTALAGNVNIVAGSLLRMANSTITTQSTVADGGNISITTTGSTLYLTDSQITTSVQSGVGQGGNITIGSLGHPFEFILLGDSQIRADAFGGPGGNINIFANVYLTSASVVSASSALSTPGTIAIEATVSDVSGSLTQLPTSPLEAAALMRASCAARLAGGKASSLVVAGREGLPLDPSGLLPSPLVEEPPVAALAPYEEFPWLRSFFWVSYLFLDLNCLR